MTIAKNWQIKLNELKKEYDLFKQGKESLLDLIFETEMSESVYNSNAIENSTLSISETEQILLNLEVSRNLSVREVFEAKNLAQVFSYIKNKVNEKSLDESLILLLHKMLISNIDESIAGRFRQKNEYVRVGSYIAPAPEHVQSMIHSLLVDYAGNLEKYFLGKISQFHLEFENIHPFCDGNGRIGRVLINYQLMRLGFPPIIIRDKEKEIYYKAFGEYRDSRQKKTLSMDKVILLALLESLHKRLAYLKGSKIVTIPEFAKTHNESSNILLNKAKRQTIPAFREKGVWKIADFNH